jgi:hypothetical protein
MPVALQPNRKLSKLDLQLADDIATMHYDPLKFVLYAYPWGEPGPLVNESGPDTWQRKFLLDLGEKLRANKFDGKSPVPPIRMAVSSGHGTGKTTLWAWVVDFIMSTRPHCRGTVTANTFTQLETKTWAAIQRWTKLCITSHWFNLTGDKMFFPKHKESWFVSAQSSKEENSEAFAGQHAADSTSFYIFDEGSAIPDKIFEVAEGGLTDGEPMIFIGGNCTRSTGKLHRVCFGNERERWDHRTVDSRESKMSNKQLIADWAQDYGEGSDFFRVRVLGLPPAASESQFIDAERVSQAQQRSPIVLPDEPLVAGVDFAWGGADENVVRFRRGNDARTVPPIRIKGEFTRDPAVMIQKLEDVLMREWKVGDDKTQRVAMLFMDSAGIAGPVAARLREMGHTNLREVNFGAHSPDYKYVFYRDFMWGKMKDWLATGAIDKDAELEADLTGPGIVPDNKQRVKLEPKEAMKKRGVDSPDDADALALTFAAPVLPGSGARKTVKSPVRVWG